VGRPGIRGVAVVLAPEQLDRWGRKAGGWPGVVRVVAGGAERSQSVLHGLADCTAPFVLVHDAARPRARPELVDEVVRATRAHGAAIPGLAVVDTVKELDAEGRIARTIPRSRLRLAQTPQGARSSWLREALERAHAAGVHVTDEAAALERDGRPVMVVAGDPDNVKVTGPADLERLRRELEGPALDLRVGSGFDVHRFADGRRLVLGGIEFPGETGLAGHSDADVVLHAAMDALLGAAGLGDIGALFPPDDPRFAGVASALLARDVAGRVRQAGFDLVNVDLTLLAETPRIRGRVEEMRRAIADCLALAPARVGLKATTLEGLGALGRREGIACQASCLLARRASAAE
jgi:2-C-methyl-D-erythritol 4-phosphate cytidylyltransferase/2-C-methyl-D-erythritol 2,4-cyclodiphosphate synthase